MARLLAEAKAMSPGEVVNAVWQVSSGSIVRRMPSRSPGRWRRGRAWRCGQHPLAENLVAQGRWTAADSALVAAERDPTAGFPGSRAG